MKILALIVFVIIPSFASANEDWLEKKLCHQPETESCLRSDGEVADQETCKRMKGIKSSENELDKSFCARLMPIPVDLHAAIYATYECYNFPGEYTPTDKECDLVKNKLADLAGKFSSERMENAKSFMGDYYQGYATCNPPDYSLSIPNKKDLNNIKFMGH